MTSTRPDQTGHRTHSRMNRTSVLGFILYLRDPTCRQSRKNPYRKKSLVLNNPDFEKHSVKLSFIQSPAIKPTDYKARRGASPDRDERAPEWHHDARKAGGLPSSVSKAPFCLSGTNLIIDSPPSIVKTLQLFFFQ